jgi:hypothetical protein
MSTHDFVLDNGPGLAVRTDMNAALQALASQNSGPTEPTTMYAGMIWLDTSVLPNGVLRQRNLSNSAWVTPTVLPPAFGTIVETVLTTSGTWTKPAGLLALEAWVVGGGGGSGQAAATAAGQSSAGSGGGGAGTAWAFYGDPSVLPATVAYTVGVGGVAGAPTGGTGGTSTFKLLTANGGAGGGGTGAGAAWGVGVQGGGGLATSTEPGSVATLLIAGGDGDQGVRAPHGIATLAWRGGAAGTMLAPFRPGSYTTGAAAAVAGRGPGAGALGPGSGASQAVQNGAAGAAGLIILREYF